MSKTPLISVVVPAYNVEKYLTACLNSILSQTFTDFEIIVINDGSTDRTPQVLEQYSSNSQIRIHHQENSGPSVARNQGLILSKGQYICFIDGDDDIAPNFLEELISPLLQGSSIDITVCGYQEIYKDHCNHHSLTPQTITGSQAVTEFLINQRDFDILVWNKLYRKSLFTDHHILYTIGQIHEDNLTTYKLYSVAKKVRYLKDELYNYQRENSQITKNLHSTEKTLKRLQAKEQMAIEARNFLTDAKLRDAASVALLLAYFAFIDNSISHRIDQKFFNQYRSKALDLYKDQQKNPHLTKKLRLYSKLLSSPQGVLYRIFRKITLKQV